jgi:uncharacterized protein
MNPIQFILIGGVKFYQWFLSPLKTALFGATGRCRFTPSCSAYAVEALRKHWAGRGAWLALRRLLRCHPWGDFGPDPVPEPGRSVRTCCRLDPGGALKNL